MGGGFPFSSFFLYFFEFDYLRGFCVVGSCDEGCE